MFSKGQTDLGTWLFSFGPKARIKGPEPMNGVMDHPMLKRITKLCGTFHFEYVWCGCQIYIL